MEIKASDLSARLLATENLSVVRARASTASFDIKSRVLTLPMWKDMTPEIEDMLIGHEVGHALYTLHQYMEPIVENPRIQTYLNVIEDVRIEKLIKRKYPGLRKRMSEGYKQLNERDFFGIKQVQDFDTLLLIDKINLYFKAGFSCGVKFTPEEKQFVVRAEHTETIDDVIQLANDIYAYSKALAQEQKNKIQGQESDDEDMISGDFDFDSDSDDEMDEEEGEYSSDMETPSSSSTYVKDQEFDETDLESKTDRQFRKNLDSLADDGTEYVYWKFSTNYFKDPVIGYKQILSETKTPEQWDNEDIRSPYGSGTNKDFEQFKTESLRTVNYLVKEFEMKKSAQISKRAMVSKVGSLDMKKVYAHKLKDDLFKRVTTLPQGKNHGMILLVDWSGSMESVLQDTLKQVINLVMFCNRVQIPYRVFAFTTDYASNNMNNIDYDRYYEYQRTQTSTKENIIDSTNPRNNLLELFSSKMSVSEFNSMAKRILDYRFRWNPGYNTGGTPLNEALVYIYQTLGQYIKNNSLEKTTFITLTDGDGHGLPTLGDYQLDDTRTESVGGYYKRVKVKNFIRDDVTQKTYELKRDGSSQTQTILQMIKDRYGVSLVGFYICENRRYTLSGAIKSNLPNFQGDYYAVVEKWKKDFRDQGFTSVKNTGRDELFIIPNSSTKIDDGELQINADANAKVIAKNFSKYLNTKKTSRVLLSRFVTLVA